MAECVLKDCLSLKQKEKILILTDKKRWHLSIPFFEVAEKMADTLLLMIPEGEYHGQEPPSLARKILKESDASLIFTTYSLTHTEAVKEACKVGARILSAPGIMKETLERAVLIDYAEQRKRMEEFLQRIKEKESVRIRTKRGTDIHFLVKGRRWLMDDGIPKRGTFSNLPAGELFIAPPEGVAEGVVFADSSVAGVKRRGEMRIEIKEGRVHSVKGEGASKFLRLLRKGEGCDVLAEFGIGFNKGARLCGNPLEDEKVWGTIHIAFGKNTSFGGANDAAIHIDCIIKEPDVYFDGVCIIKRGRHHEV